MDWQPIETAPKDGTEIRMKGRWPGSAAITEVNGLYETGGYTEGWVDGERHNVFYPTDWLPLPHNKDSQE